MNVAHPENASLKKRAAQKIYIIGILYRHNLINPVCVSFFWKRMYWLQMISSYSYFYQCTVFLGKEILRSGSNNNTNNIRRGIEIGGENTSICYRDWPGKGHRSSLPYPGDYKHVNNESSWQKRLKIIWNFWDDHSSVPTSYFIELNVLEQNVPHMVKRPL